MKKEQVLKSFINDTNSFLPKERQFLNENFEDFCNFVEVKPVYILDYGILTLKALKVLEENGLEGDMLLTVENVLGYIRKEFEKYCVEFALRGVK